MDYLIANFKRNLILYTLKFEIIINNLKKNSDKVSISIY